MNDFFLLTNAVGTIQAGPYQQERLDELINRLRTDELYEPVVGTVPTRCIDGRPGTLPLAPNAAGGTETLMVADDLTVKRYAADTTLESFSNVINALQAAGHPIGGHTDEHALDSASGCGANDKLEPIYRFIAEHGDVLRDLTVALGIAVDDTLHRSIVSNAAARTEFSPGSELLTVLMTAGGDEAVDMLEGDHKEVVAVINTRTGSTLNRRAVIAEFGPDYGVFNIDTWAIASGVREIARDGGDEPALEVAALYYNLATAHVLCGPAMRVIVR